jgi:hypothetical protein
MPTRSRCCDCLAVSLICRGTWFAPAVLATAQLQCWGDFRDCRQLWPAGHTARDHRNKSSRCAGHGRWRGWNNRRSIVDPAAVGSGPGVPFSSKESAPTLQILRWTKRKSRGRKRKASAGWQALVALWHASANAKSPAVDIISLLLARNDPPPTTNNSQHPNPNRTSLSPDSTTNGHGRAEYS